MAETVVQSRVNYGRGERVTTPVYLQGRPQTKVTTNSSTGTATAAMPEGYYDMWSDGDIYIKIGPDVVTDVTIDTGYLIRAGNTVEVVIPNNSLVGAIAVSGTPVLRMMRTD